jgi:hypothetical protein
MKPRQLLSLTLLILFTFGGTVPIYPQEREEYEPYQNEEFPLWLRNLRRGEVIFFGSLPITILLSDMLFSVGRYASSGFNIDYAPLISGGTASVISNEERVQRLIAAATGSLVLVLVDFILGRIEKGGS